MRVLNISEVTAVSGAGSAPLLNLNFNLNFFLALFSIFKKTTTTTNNTTNNYNNTPETGGPVG